MPRTEWPLVEKLCMHYLPHLKTDPEALRKLMLTRMQEPAPIVPSVITEEHLNEAEDALDDDMKEVLFKAAKKNPANKGSSSASGSNQVYSGPRRPTKICREFFSDEDPGYEFALQLAPVGCPISRDDRLHLRWLIHFPSALGSQQEWYTKAWADDLPPIEALKIVLEAAWSEYERLEFGKRWFVIDKLPEIEVIGLAAP